jgi:hypothetical protein
MLKYVLPSLSLNVLELNLEKEDLKMKNNILLSGTAILITCNPSYLGGGDWEDHNLRSAQAKSS